MSANGDKKHLELISGSVFWHYLYGHGRARWHISFLFFTHCVATNSTPFFTVFSNPIPSQVEVSTTADAVPFIHALCLTKQQQHSLARHLCNKPSTHPSSGSMSECNDVSLSMRATLTFTCNSSHGICPCEQCACIGGSECPMPAPLVSAHPHSTAVLLWPSATVCP